MSFSTSQRLVLTQVLAITARMGEDGSGSYPLELRAKLLAGSDSEVLVKFLSMPDFTVEATEQEFRYS